MLPKHDVDIHFSEHLKCPYRGKLTGCTVYELRPFVCRVYGVVPGLPCPHGCTAIVPLTKDEEAKLKEAYRALNRKEGGKKLEFI